MSNQTSHIPEHVTNLLSNLSEIETLVGIKGAITGNKVGKPDERFEVLNKSALVLCVACWEAFVEDTASQAFEIMLAKASTPEEIPNKVLSLAARPYFQENDRRVIWDLAGDGWKAALRSYETQVLKETIGKLNTPRPAQVNTIFESIVGLRNVANYWYWPGMSNDSARRKLNALVTRRGEVAHRVKASNYVRLRYVNQSLGLVQRLAAVTSNRVRDHLTDIFGDAPWNYVSYGSVN